jgi:FtsP/CotA-like multicopper oxidase with cupredoxin domain
MINGEAYSASTPALPAGVASERLLVRFINAGLKTRTPMLLRLRMSVIAEDGNEYAYPRDQYTLTLPAGQTRDAIITIPSGAAAGTRYPVLDRMMGLTNNGSATPGGMLRFLEVQ